MPETSYRGEIFRALNPVFAREPFTGRGAELYGGRFNPKGVPALYASLSVMTALREANQAGSFQPTTLVCYDVEIDDVFNAGDARSLAAEGFDAAMLADSGWRDQMKMHGESKTQAFSRRLIAHGYNGLLVQSFATGTTANDLNLVLWHWSDRRPARVTVIDDEHRLSN